MQRKFLLHHRVVASQVGEMTLGCNRGLGQFQVEKVWNSREHAIVAAHDLLHCPRVSGVNLRGRDLSRAGQFLDASDCFAQALQVGICECNCFYPGASSHIKRRSPTHHACTNHKNFHDALYETEYEDLIEMRVLGL